MDIRPTRTIAVANGKGGVEKTALVINLGAALVLKEKSVLIIDMDPQFNATRGLGIDIGEGALTVYDIIMNDRYQNLLFDTTIRINTTIAESTAVGKPVIFYRPACHGSSDFVELAEEMINRG